MSTSAKFGPGVLGAPQGSSFLRDVNTRWHKPALQLFTVVVLGHWAEHLAQAYQIWALHWPRPRAGGVLGLFFPFLVSSEILHYGYALVMLIGLLLFRAGFTGRSRPWWNIALGIQIWHHFEHLLLFGQATFHHNLFGSPVPTSIVQLWFPRVELHLFYNTIVFIPLVIAMYYHIFPPAGEEAHTGCTCAYGRAGAQCSL